MTLLLSFQFVLVLISDPYLNPTLINKLKEINSSTSAFLPDSLCICELKGTNCSSSRMAQGKRTDNNTSCSHWCFIVCVRYYK